MGDGDALVEGPTMHSRRWLVDGNAVHFQWLAAMLMNK